MPGPRGRRRFAACGPDRSAAFGADLDAGDCGRSWRISGMMTLRAHRSGCRAAMGWSSALIAATRVDGATSGSAWAGEPTRPDDASSSPIKPGAGDAPGAHQNRWPDSRRAGTDARARDRGDVDRDRAARSTDPRGTRPVRSLRMTGARIDGGTRYVTVSVCGGRRLRRRKRAGELLTRLEEEVPAAGSVGRPAPSVRPVPSLSDARSARPGVVGPGEVRPTIDQRTRARSRRSAPSLRPVSGTSACHPEESSET